MLKLPITRSFSGLVNLILEIEPLVLRYTKSNKYLIIGTN